MNIHKESSFFWTTEGQPFVEPYSIRGWMVARIFKGEEKVFGEHQPFDLFSFSNGVKQYVGPGYESSAWVTHSLELAEAVCITEALRWPKCTFKLIEVKHV